MFIRAGRIRHEAMVTLLMPSAGGTIPRTEHPRRTARPQGPVNRNTSITIRASTMLLRVFGSTLSATRDITFPAHMVAKYPMADARAILKRIATKASEQKPSRASPMNSLTAC